MLAFDFEKHNTKYPVLPLGCWDDEDEKMCLEVLKNGID